MATLFISDLHLSSRHPAITEQCLKFLDGEAKRADSLYILGDLFEVWVGDDDPEPSRQQVVKALHELARTSGVPCYFMRGNRDFLAGEVFSAHSGCHMLDDPTVVSLYGQDVLLMHGDTLCTDDVEYQQFRKLVRDPMWQQDFLSEPLSHRLAMAEAARDASRTETASKPAEIMDVNQGAVEQAMARHGVNTMIHGHTHRPGIHEFEIDGKRVRRIVLGDWHETGSVLRMSSDGVDLTTLPR